MEYMWTHEIDRIIHETVKEAVTASVQYAMRAPLRARFKDLPTSDMKEILLQRMLEENYDKGHEDHKMAYEALQKSILSDESEQFDANKAKKLKKKTRKFKPSTSSIPEDVFMHEESDVKAQNLVSDDKDIGSRHIPKVNLNQEWFKPFSKEERPVTPEPAWPIHSLSLHVLINNWASVIAFSYVPPSENSLLSQTDDIGGFIDWFYKKQGITQLTTEHLKVDDRLLRYNVSRPLPLGGPPGQVTIQTEFFFNKDLEYLRFGNKGDRLALSITKIKAAHYPDAWLEQMVPDQIWIEEECMYNISATYGISHWWFKRQKFYIDRHLTDTNRRAIVKTHMRILSEYTIAKNDFKDLYPRDFEDLYLLNLQGYLNHLPPRDKKILATAVNLWIRNLVIIKRVEDFQLGIESYQTQLNLTKPRWEATGLEFIHDYKILNTPRAVLSKYKYGMQMLMRFNEIHKFSDGTLQQIDEALDYRVKEFNFNKNNLGLNTSSRESSGTWKALLVEEYAKETIDFYGESNDDIFSIASSTSCVDGKVRYKFPRSRQSQRDLPRDNSLVSVEVLRYDYKRSNVNKGIVRTEMKLVLEHTQQGTSNEVSVSTEGVEE
ncbi:hypothetical protein Tco_0725901 [Tanacetum coccineum]|uniref:Uncharacterized protein n=1 Tax=Tanacetum coccineum TaxID=301880 RepID=A0ABQ4YE77_9ASTR